MKPTPIVLLFFLLGFAACSGGVEQKATVLSTAYNSVAGQTQGNPNKTAFGDTLRPGMKAIAVSRDLEEKGLTAGTEVRIEGLGGSWVVRDRMHARWKNKIDIYLGKDVEAAKNWGRREVEIRWDAQ